VTEPASIFVLVTGADASTVPACWRPGPATASTFGSRRVRWVQCRAGQALFNVVDKRLGYVVDHPLADQLDRR